MAEQQARRGGCMFVARGGGIFGLSPCARVNKGRQTARTVMATCWSSSKGLGGSAPLPWPLLPSPLVRAAVGEPHENDGDPAGAALKGIGLTPAVGAERLRLRLRGGCCCRWGLRRRGCLAPPSRPGLWAATRARPGFVHGSERPRGSLCSPLKEVVVPGKLHHGA